ncbi:LysR substrate-binding domain-containing protein [Thaumasiovibrio subtropicus]|uniref:LysR substrate-binding domain-containing protein n=1 Tax=Thaumasiovibrio subtropicus TaxID=1891207 RepID=UPI000B353BD6|nr:LysR substrate-binding domain-containing protein [Thaumasiovibrio subtropicus]
MLVSNKLMANLHTLTIVAKHLSFTKAADELSLTQGAISHRIKGLESELGFQVFVRLTRSLALTPEGERLINTLHHSLAAINSELEDLSGNALFGELVVGTSPAFATNWLMPRLHRFHEEHPHLNIKLFTKHYRGDFQYDALDAAIFYSRGRYIDSYSERLFSEERIPVCSALYAEKLGLLAGDLTALSQATFIHGEHSEIWSKWLDHMAMTIDCYARSHTFTQYDHAIMAAQNSMGIAMARKVVAAHYLQTGDLVAPFPSISSGMGYDLVCPDGMQSRQKFVVFADWLRREAALMDG